MPTQNLTLSPETLQGISDLVVKHLRPLHDDITGVFPGTPEAAFAVALGFAAATFLDAAADEVSRDAGAEAMNAMLGEFGYALVPTTGPGTGLPH